MTTDMDSKEQGNGQHRRTRLEDEVIEILTRADRPPTPIERVRGWRHRGPRPIPIRRGRIAAYRQSGRFLTRLSSGGWLIACVVTGILTLLVADASPLLARALAIISITCFIVPIITRWKRPGQPEVKRWRGHDIDFRDDRPDLLDDFKRRFRRPPRR